MIVEMGIFNGLEIFVSISWFVQLNNFSLHIFTVFLGLSHSDE